MAISSTLPISGFGTVIATRAVSVRDANSLAQQIPSLAGPGVAVTIGATTLAPQLYNSAGLLRALVGLDSAGALPSGADPGAVSSELQGNLETVLGLNSEAGSLGVSDSIGSLANLSADSLQALNNVLADGLDTTATGASGDQALRELLAQTLNASSSGLDRTTAAASVVNTSGVLRAASADESLRALNALPTSDLGLAATALDTGIGDAGLPHNALNDASSLAFNRLLATRLEQAIGELDTSRPRRRPGGSAGASDLLLSGVSLLTAATDAAALVGEAALTADELALAQGLSAESLVRLALQTPRRADEAAPTGNTQALFATEITEASAPRASAAGLQATAQSGAATPTAAALNPAPTPLRAMTDAPGASITLEPRYAELAASMTMGAAVYRYQASVALGVPPGAVDPARTVQTIRPIREVERIS
ncbi:MAG: hypothetical protein Q8S20_09820 [Sulfuritalea sp.]|nr:hypothetical protein [Sulfuritalea sp.]